MDLPQGKTIEFKFLQRIGDNTAWQNGPNRRLQVPSNRSSGMGILSRWEGDWSTDVAWTMKPSSS